MNSKNNIFLGGLNEVRGVAALAVLFSHIDQFHVTLRNPEIGIENTGIASYAVTSFFVLSGFLITYLLSHEIHKHNKIDIKKFYIRRILRIWPPYYLTILISIVLMGVGWFVFPSVQKFWSGLGLFVFMLPNLGAVLSLTFPATTPLWSIGVEEQFYLVWPHLYPKLKSANYLLWIPLLMMVFISLRVFLYVYDPSGGLYVLVKGIQFQNLLLGALTAILFVNTNQTFLKLITHPVAQVVSLIVLGLPFVIETQIWGDFYIEVFALGSVVIIFNTALNKDGLFKLRSKLLDFVGRLSYGIYVYHFLMIYLVISFTFISNVYISYFAIISLTIGFSYLSFKFIESPILKNRAKFSRV